MVGIRRTNDNKWVAVEKNGGHIKVIGDGPYGGLGAKQSAIADAGGSNKEIK